MAEDNSQLTEQEAIVKIDQIYAVFLANVEKIRQERDSKILQIFQQSQAENLAKIRQIITSQNPPPLSSPFQKGGGLKEGVN